MGGRGPSDHSNGYAYRRDAATPAPMPSVANTDLRVILRSEVMSRSDSVRDFALLAAAVDHLTQRK
jgi:hypothetical protein